MSDEKMTLENQSRNQHQFRQNQPQGQTLLQLCKHSAKPKKQSPAIKRSRKSTIQ